MATFFKTLREYLYQKDKQFVVPNYQRGYKWAVEWEEPKDGYTSHVDKLCGDLIKAFTEKKEDYFLQGITVSERENQIILIDGQQRTTTLYLLLWCLDKSKIKDIKLVYDIRSQSRAYIENLQKDDFDHNNNSDDDIQDIYYFKKAIEQINRRIENLTDKNGFLDFILDNVQIIYIQINDEDKAVQTFTMMNGNKATMLSEELIKAEMLRKVSLPDKESQEDSGAANVNPLEATAKEWETNAIRSRYAREWDKWLYWWNRQDVREFFRVDNPMGLLLEYCFTKQEIGKNHTQNKLEDVRRVYSFDSFKSLLADKKCTKEQFKKLRDLQKSFEDIFNQPKLHNYLKLSLLCSSNDDDKFEVINEFIEKKNEKDLKDDYAKWRLVGATHLETVNEKDADRKQKAIEVLGELSGRFVYSEAYDLAAKQLLRLNVEEDNKLFDGKGRKFDFRIYGNKSLEHIHPKSKVYHIANEDGTEITIFKDGNENSLGTTAPQGTEWLNRDELTGCTEHSIGNLLLLDKNENSKFRDNPFEQKKEIYFNVNENFKSRNLLHTISVFASSKWGKEEVEKTQEKFIERFKQDYGI